LRPLNFTQKYLKASEKILWPGELLSWQYRLHVPEKRKEHSSNRIFSEQGLWAVSAAVIKMHTQPMGIRFTTVWKYCEQQWFQNMTRELLYIVTVLLSHRIDDVKSIDFQHNAQHGFLGPDLLLHLLRDLISRYAPFHIITKFQVDQLSSPLANPWNLFFSWALWMDNNSRQVSIRICRKLIVNSCGTQFQWKNFIPSDSRKWLKIVEWETSRASEIESAEWKGCLSSNTRIWMSRKLIGGLPERTSSCRFSRYCQTY
jgi:hypothetical protein